MGEPGLEPGRPFRGRGFRIARDLDCMEAQTVRNAYGLREKADYDPGRVKVELLKKLRERIPVIFRKLKVATPDGAGA